MVRRASNVMLKQGRRGTCRRSRMGILASPETIRLGRAGAAIELQKSALNTIRTLRCLKSSDRWPKAWSTATAASTDAALTNAPIIRTYKTGPYCAGFGERRIQLQQPVR